jgi:hypothetical protein
MEVQFQDSAELWDPVVEVRVQDSVLDVQA